MDRKDFKFFIIAILFNLVSFYFLLKTPEDYILLSAISYIVINFITAVIVGKAIEEEYI